MSVPAFPHTFGYDGLGSTRILTDVTGTVQNSYGYQAFGELDYEYGSVENNYLFTGEQYDNNVGFYYLRARYYNPGIGRFSQMDVFPGMQFEPVTLHKYLYANANPVSIVDPSGYVGLSQFLGGTMKVLTTLTGYAVAVYNIIDRVENAVSLYQAVDGLYAAYNKIKSGGWIDRVSGDQEFLDAMSKWDDALHVLSKNVGKIFHEMNHPRKRKQIQLFVKNPKAQLLIFGPTPGQNTPWMGLDNRTKLGRIGIGKKRRDLMLELGRKSGSGGRMIGMGHGFKGRRETEQWWRMDYHSGHGPGTSDWADGDYHFHTLTAGGNK